MKATGIIVEYNPFHNGHKLHAHAAKKETNADILIAVMSGNFLQRGEPAFLDKWTRTELALKNGVDIVIELPYAFATAHAPVFAKGAVQLLDALHCQAYCFGSEEGHIAPFENSLALLRAHHTEYERLIRHFITEGMSYPKALNHAYERLINIHQESKPFINLTQPNNILGFHYMQAANQLNSPMFSATIKRVGADYHDESLENKTIGSATAIRKTFFATNELDAVQNFIPSNVYDTLRTRHEQTDYFGHWATFYPFLRMIILRDTPKKLVRIADVTEGIENLIYQSALQHASFDNFMETIKSKRYTWTRIQRMLTHILTGYTYDTREKIAAPSYLRLLGMTDDGRRYLNSVKKNVKYPIISKVSAFSSKSIDFDVHATNIYAIGLGDNSMVNADFKKAPIYIR